MIHALYLLRLENHTQKAADQAHHGKGSADERADGGDELVPALALGGDGHGHGRQVVAEASLGDLVVGVLHDLRGLHQLVG